MSALWWIPPSLLAQCPDSFRNGLLALAEAAVERLNKLHAYTNRGMLYVALNEYEKAEADFRKAAELDPASADLWGSWAASYMKRGMYQEAHEKLSKAIELSPHSLNARMGRGIANFHLGKTQEALDDFTKGIERHERFADGWFCRGQVYEKLGDLDRAMADFSQAVQLDADNPRYLVERAQLHQTTGQPEKARADFEKLVELCAAAIAKNPNVAWVWNMRGVAYHELQQYEKALADFTKAIELQPTPTPTHHEYFNRAHTYAELGQWEPAASDFAKIIELGRPDAQPFYYQGLLRLRAGDKDGYGRACAQMLERLGLNPLPDTAYWAAWTCLLGPDALPDFTRPVELAQQAVESDPKSLSYLNALGGILYRAGRVDEAIDSLLKADRLAQEPDASTKSSPAYTWYFLAMAHWKQGHKEEARNWHQKAAEWTDRVLREAEQAKGAALAWNRRLTLNLLRAEAEELLGVDEKNEKN